MTSPGKKKSLVVGVTGGIGSGKTAVCSLFARLGRTVLSADAIAGEITENNLHVRERIQSVFGRDTYADNGQLDRKRLADLAFSDRRNLATLNAIVHPEVFREIDKRVASLPDSRGKPYVIIEAALIFESGMDKTLDHILLVHADAKERIRRVMNRDKATEDDVTRRMKLQMPESKKLELADFVIRNNGTLEQLEAGVRFLDRIFQNLS